MGNWNFDHEWPYIQNIKAKLKLDSIAIDVGAHIGMYGIALQEKLKTIYSFEPVIYSFEALLKNSVLFPSIVPFHLYAIGKTSPETKSSIFTEENISLDKFFGDTFQVDFIKLDTDGKEIEILEGAENIIKNNTKLIILIEFEMGHLICHNISSDQFFERLKNIGLDCSSYYASVKQSIVPTSFLNLIIIKDGQSITVEGKM